MTMVTETLDDELYPPGAGAPARTEIQTGDSHIYVPSLVLAAATAWLLWTGLTTLERSNGLWSGLAAGRAELVAPTVVILIALALACERRWPAERRGVLARGHLHDGAFFIFHVVAVIPLMTLLSVAFAELIVSHASWIEVSWTAAWPRWLLLAVTITLMDASNWLAHWADHRFTPLWRMHALHHSQEELNVLTSFRAHPLSHLLGFFFAAIPVIVLMGNRGMAPELITAYVCLGTLPHANLRWSFGPLGKIFVSPAYHRLHHSIDGPNGYNLGVVLTVWDVLAGRALFPSHNAPVVRTGLADRPLSTEQAAGDRWHPEVLLAQLAEPFVIRRSGSA